MNSGSATALSEGRMKEMLSEALKGEADIAELPGADERLLEALGRRRVRGGDQAFDRGIRNQSR